MLTPRSLLTLAPGSSAPDGFEGWPEATGVAFSTLLLKPGDAFFALAGESAHGIDYADQALQLGASFIVSDRPHPRGLLVDDPASLLNELGRRARSQLRGTVIGVSGSVGKTTTKDMLGALTAARTSPGNLNTPNAIAGLLVESALNHPERDLVIEMGIDRPGDMDRLVDLVRPDAGILTSIAAAHAEYLGPLASIADEKRPLLEASSLRVASLQALGHLGESPEGTITYGFEPDAAEQGTFSPPDRLQWAGRTWHSPLPGSAAAQNLLGALVLASRLGVSGEALERRLAHATVTGGRLQVRRTRQRTVLDDSYNSNPTSMAAALEVLATLPRPHSAVLGDMRELGDQSRQLHRELGEATSHLDLVIAAGEFAPDVFSTNPRVVVARDTEHAIALLELLPGHGSTLVKASRSLGFERITHELIKEEEEAP